MLDWYWNVAIALGALAAYTAYAYVGRGLYKVPGPFIASVTSLWKFLVIWKEEIPWTNLDLHRKHGPLVRIGPKHISASSVEAVRQIYTQGKGFQKSSIYNLLQPKLGTEDLHNVFSTQDIAYHTQLKRNIGSLYTMSAVTDYEANFDRSIGVFTEKLKGFAKRDGVPMDIGSWLQYFTFDSLAEVNFSERLGFLERGEDIDHICELDHDMMLYFAIWGQIPPTLERLVHKLSFWRRVVKPNPLYEFTLRIVKERLEKPDSEKNDMLNTLLRVHLANPGKVNEREVIGAAYINMVTAHDVLAITLRALLYYLCRNPRFEQRLQEEIKEACNSGKVASPANYAAVGQLPYLNAVINETLRVHPSTGLIFERYVPKGGVTMHDTYLPAGTIVGINAWVINRDKSLFGEDADEFLPERWIDSDPDKLSLMRKAMLTWGAGARNCIGKNMAMMVLTKTVFELYRNFEFKLAHPEREWKVSGGWLTRQTDMEMTIAERPALVEVK